MHVHIEPSWQTALQQEFSKAYFADLVQQVREAYRTTRVYPHAKDLFQAFALCPLGHTRIVILGQDPYHGPGQAHGLAFSVPAGIRIPPSLRNIFQELHNDLGYPIPHSGDLTPWAQQGVLLLNATLSVAQASPGSHQHMGWEVFTDAVIHTLAQHTSHLVFMLWGSYAQKKASLIPQEKHCILRAPHPSPLSASRGFLGCRHFSKANAYLQQHNMSPIDWQLA